MILTKSNVVLTQSFSVVLKKQKTQIARFDGDESGNETDHGSEKFQSIFTPFRDVLQWQIDKVKV